MSRLIDLVPHLEIRKLFNYLTQTGKKEYLKLSVCKKIPLSCFYLQLELDN